MTARKPVSRGLALRNPVKYVEITRDDLEEWLGTLGFTGAQKWLRDPKFAGVYLLPLSPHVAIRLASTIGSSDSGVGVGEGSMKVSLVALLAPNAVPLNKKAVVGSTGKIKHFYRTLNWRKNWVEGIDVLRAEYLGSKRSFYDRIAQERAPQRPAASPAPAPPRDLAAHRPPAPTPPAAPQAVPAWWEQDGRRLALVDLYRRAKAVGDQATMELAGKIGRQTMAEVGLIGLDHTHVRRAMAQYGVPFDYPSDADHAEAMGSRPQRNPARRSVRAGAGGRW